MGVLKQIWFYEILVGILLICQNVTVRVCGARVRIYYVFFKKDILNIWRPVQDPELVRGGLLGAPACVKIAYFYMGTSLKIA